MSAEDELTATACLAVQRLTPIKKAQFLLNTALALIEDRVYGEEVETYLDVCLKTPGLPKEDAKKALFALRNAQGRPVQLDPSNGQVQSKLPCKEPEIHFSIDPACQRIPPEIWDKIAAQTPRYHLRIWLFVSPVHRGIASRHLFHTVHIKFLEYQFESFNRGLDILTRAINDPVFASQVKSLRLHFEYEEGDASDVIFRILAMSLHKLKAFRDFEWIGNLEIPEEVVQILMHKSLQGLGLKGWRNGVDTISAFHGLRKFGFHGDKDNEETELEDILAVLDPNESTLKHLIIDECPYFDSSLDSVFESVTINNLTHLDLSTEGISGSVLSRISEAKNLQSLTLCGSFEEPDFVSQMFATHTISLPDLESFRFVMDEDELLHYSISTFLQKRENLRRLDLGSCPWDIVQPVLPDLRGLRVLAVYIDKLSEEQIESLVGAIPTQMVAIQLSVGDCDITSNECASYFTRFKTLSFLHLPYQMKPAGMLGKDFQMQMAEFLRSIAAAVPSLDFLAWHDKLYVVVRPHGDMGPTVELKELPTNSRLEYGSGVDVVSEDIAWLQHKTYRWDSEDPE